MSDQQVAKRKVLAVQAFIDERTADRVMEVRERLSRMEGLSCSFFVGTIPHITIASWWVTDSEYEVARRAFVERLSAMDAVEAPVSLDEWDDEERWNRATYSYHLSPERTSQLMQLHSRIHEDLGFTYEPFREIDLPGSWLPHLTLFTIPKEQKDQVSSELNCLRAIDHLRITRLGLVTFDPEVVVAVETPLVDRAG